MSKLKALLGGYIGKFYGEPNKYRTNLYLLIHKSGRLLDYEGWQGTRRELHNFEEFGTKQEALDFLDEHIAKSDRDDWVLYKRQTTKL